MKRVTFRRKFKPLPEPKTHAPAPPVAPRTTQSAMRKMREHVDIGRRTWFIVEFHEVVDGARFIWSAMDGEYLANFEKRANHAGLNSMTGELRIFEDHEEVLARFGDFNG